MIKKTNKIKEKRERHNYSYCLSKRFLQLTLQPCKPLRMEKRDLHVTTKKILLAKIERQGDECMESERQRGKELEIKS